MISKKNKTINISVEDGANYLDKCIKVIEPKSLDTIINKTLNGNTFDILPLLPKNFVDLLIVDPPYNLTKNYQGNKFYKKTKEEYKNYTNEWIKLCLPLLKKNASIYVCSDWETSLIVGDVLSNFFHIRNRITWQREKGRGAKSNWKNGMEDIWFATNSNDYVFNLDAVKIRKKVIAPYRVDGKPKDWAETENGNYRDTYPSNFWDDITIPFWSMPENTAHPTQKPEKLIAKIILASSNQNDIVFDPFLGSGTTSVVAKKLQRKYVGIEQNEQCCIWAEKRLEMATQNKKIQGYNNNIFLERNYK